jgi:hypothetical protein
VSLFVRGLYSKDKGLRSRTKKRNAASCTYNERRQPVARVVTVFFGNIFVNNPIIKEINKGLLIDYKTDYDRDESE